MQIERCDFIRAGIIAMLLPYSLSVAKAHVQSAAYRYDGDEKRGYERA